MADLYAKQGHRDQALVILRKLAAERPGDTEVRRRLAQLQPQGEKMGFREHLQRVVDSTPGALACTIMGFDGIAIDTYQTEGTDLDVPTLLTEVSATAHQLKQAGVHQPVVAGLSEISVYAQQMAAVVRIVSDEYFLAVVLSPGGLVGKARYLLRAAQPRILEELS